MIVINQSNVSPQILLDFDKGVFDMHGISCPENSLYFYKSVFNAFDTLTRIPEEMTANFKLRIFNTSSAKCLFDIMRRLKGLSQKGTLVTINWMYEEDDEDILECGEDFSDLLDLEFLFTSYQTTRGVFERS